MHITPSSPFPVDFDSLQKGDVIAPEIIENAYGISRDLRAYAFAALNLKTRIECELENRGYPVSTKIEGSSIRILTDEEAVPYNAMAFEAGVAKMGRSHRRLNLVDVGKLSQLARSTHDRAIAVQAFQLQALRKARRAELGQ